LLLFSREIARASGERDRAIAALELDTGNDNNVFEKLYALPAPTKEKSHDNA
jgi:hypothetical protein